MRQYWPTTDKRLAKLIRKKYYQRISGKMYSRKYGVTKIYKKYLSEMQPIETFISLPSEFIYLFKISLEQTRRIEREYKYFSPASHFPQKTHFTNWDKSYKHYLPKITECSKSFQDNIPIFFLVNQKCIWNNKSRWIFSCIFCESAGTKNSLPPTLLTGRILLWLIQRRDFHI